MHTFLVGTGIVSFSIDANSPRQAIETLKSQIRARRNQEIHETIGMSLVTALEARTLNFLVVDPACTTIFAGEFNGEFRQPPTRQQAETMRILASPALLSSLPDNN